MNKVETFPQPDSNEYRKRSNRTTEISEPHNEVFELPDWYLDTSKIDRDITEEEVKAIIPQLIQAIYQARPKMSEEDIKFFYKENISFLKKLSEQTLFKVAISFDNEKIANNPYFYAALVRHLLRDK